MWHKKSLQLFEQRSDVLKFWKGSQHSCSVENRLWWVRGEAGRPVRLLRLLRRRGFKKRSDSGYILKVESHAFLADWIWDEGAIGLSRMTADPWMKWLPVILRFEFVNPNWHSGTDVTIILIYLVSPNFKFSLVHSSSSPPTKII